MKRFGFIFATALLLSSSSLFAQTEYSTDYEVQYNVSYSLDSLNLDKKKNEKVFLFVGPKYGVFLNYNEANAETIKEELERQSRTGNINMSEVIKPTDFFKQFYKNKQENEVVVVSKAAGKYLSYTEEATPLTWEITEETKEFMGYQTQKATTSFAGRAYEAWFTLEIPISDGPYIFYGLPGLIVELYDTHKHYTFELVSIEKLEEARVWEIPEAAMNMTKEKYQDLIDKQTKDLSINSVLSSSNINLPDAPTGGKVSSKVVIKDQNGREISEADFKRMRKKSEESKNNPIELK